MPVRTLKQLQIRVRILNTWEHMWVPITLANVWVPITLANVRACHKILAKLTRVHTLEYLQMLVLTLKYL